MIVAAITISMLRHQALDLIERKLGGVHYLDAKGKKLKRLESGMKSLRTANLKELRKAIQSYLEVPPRGFDVDRFDQEIDIAVLNRLIFRKVSSLVRSDSTLAYSRAWKVEHGHLKLQPFSKIARRADYFVPFGVHYHALDEFDKFARILATKQTSKR